jgi:hypothetical protein
MYMLPWWELGICCTFMQFLMTREGILAGKRSTTFFADEWLSPRIFSITWSAFRSCNFWRFRADGDQKIRPNGKQNGTNHGIMAVLRQRSCL